MKHIYQQTIDELFSHFQTGSQGLSAKQARILLSKYGLNSISSKPPRSLFLTFLSQFTSPLIYILVIAAALIFFLAGDRLDAFVIIGILLFNAIIGTIQESRTQKILASLAQFITQETVVIRNNARTIVATKDLVPGDSIIVQAGQRVPADARVLEAHNLIVDESMLTGESTPVHKYNQVLLKDLPLAEHTNMLYSGTYVISGWGTALVVATGLHSQIGKIQQMAQEVHTDVPLEKEMRQLAWVIIYFIVGMCAFLFGIGFLAGEPIKELLVMLTALFICVIPEGLPVVLTLVLVNGVYRMAKQKVLVKNMQAVEGLGHATVMVIDKTGTLTRNEMIASHLFADNKTYTISGKGYYAEGEIFLDAKPIEIAKKSDLHMLGQALYLLNTTTVTSISERGTFDIKGDPTEAALFVLAQKMGINAAHTEQFYKIYEVPFDSQGGYHALFVSHGNQGIGFIGAAPEIVFAHVQKNAAARHALDAFLQKGLRVIAIAKNSFALDMVPATAQEKRIFFERLALDNLELLGICGIEDCVRPEAAETISKARKAGLAVIMATGDHQRTALAIAKQVGIYREGDEAIDGPELEKLTDAQLQAMIMHITVFSRVSPEQKLRIIKALHSNNQIVAMTGDGINDAPSLLAADIGIGMGGIGTEVAKEASDIILLDDSVVNILHAIEQGRHTIYTLRRVILYFFSTNCAEILIILFAFVAGLLYPGMHLAFPLTAAQILWLNLVTDGFLDSALALEKKEKGLLFEQKWLQRGNIKLVDGSIIIKTIFGAIVMAAGSLVVFILYNGVNLNLARTMTLVTLVMFQWFNAWNCRSETKSIFSLGFCSNKWLVGATAIVFCLQLLLLQVPFLQAIFATRPLTIYQWLFIAALSSSIIWLEELRKWCVRHYN